MDPFSPAVYSLCIRGNRTEQGGGGEERGEERTSEIILKDNKAVEEGGFGRVLAA